MDTTTGTSRLLEQLTWHWEHQARPRLRGMSDEEYRWEPVPGAWNVRRREDATTPMASGAGDWVVDYAWPTPEPAPVTTIAWRLAHVTVGCFGARAHSHFGGPPADYFTWDYPPDAATALRQLDDGFERWVAGVRGLDDDALERPVGEAEGEWASHPMAELVLHINREAIHHLAEIALLRDLYRAQRR
ncbi:MAG TPA: DinB family protein [Acidimicrobiales bacterium]|nr:DinB family protein [Acidimicrobiales bacterium]